MKIRKCEALNTGKMCGKKARFKIVDFECGSINGDYQFFFVCEDCIKFFVSTNEDNPHYVLLEDLVGGKKNESK